METFSFELRLIDGVTASSKKAKDAVDGISASAKKAQHALNFTKELERTEQQLKKLHADPVGFKRLIHAQKELAEMQKKLGKESFFSAFKDKLNFGRLVSASFFGDMLAESLTEGVHKAVEIFADGIKDAFKAVAHEQKFSLGENTVLGGAKEGDEFRERAEKLGKQSSFVPSQIRELMLPLRANGFSPKASEQAFGSAADLAAMKGKAGDMGIASSVIEAIDKLKVKGGAGPKQLAALLDGTGDTLQTFYEQIGKMKGVSAASAEKLLKSGGQIDPQIVMNAFSGAIDTRTGGAPGALDKKASKGLGPRAEHLQALPDQFLERLAKAPGVSKLSDSLGAALEQLSPDSPQGAKIMGALMSMFDKLTKSIDELLKPENIDRFIVGLTAAGKVAESTLDAVSATLQVLAKVIDAYNNMSGFAGDMAKLGGGDANKGTAKMLTDSGDVWDKVKKAENVSRFQDWFTLMGDDRDALVKKALGEGKITSEEAGTWGGKMPSAMADLAPVARVDAASGAGSVVNNNTANNNVVIHVHGGNLEEVKQAVLDATGSTGKHQSATSASELAAQSGG